jgi:DNA excision repair protein ERCC-2
MMAILDFVSILSTYEDNISVCLTTKHPFLPKSEFRCIQLACHDASLIFSEFSNTKRLVLTGCALSPLSMYSRMMQFEPISAVCFPLRIARPNVIPIVISRGTDQSKLSTMADVGANLKDVNNYGRLISDLVPVVPDGIVCLFPNFHLMHDMVKMWSDSGVLVQILQYKLLFIEPQTPSEKYGGQEEKYPPFSGMEACLVIDNYKRACDTGRGAVYFGISGGKSEGVDLSGHWGRCFILMGMPEPQRLDPTVAGRAEFLDCKFQIPKNDFILFNSMRIACSSVSKVLNAKKDYAVLLFADWRYDQANAKANLPQWIRDSIHKDQVDQSVDDAVGQVKLFFIKMSQNYVLGSEAIEDVEQEMTVS